MSEASEGRELCRTPRSKRGVEIGTDLPHVTDMKQKHGIVGIEWRQDETRIVHIVAIIYVWINYIHKVHRIKGNILVL